MLHPLQVKSAQVFKRPVQSIVAGDRAGICVTQLDAGLLERGLAAAPGSVPTFAAAIARVDKIRFFPGEVHSKGTYHIIISHETVMAQVTFFGLPDGQGWPETGGWVPAR
jgi:selenocysteine-specific elongation factor